MTEETSGETRKFNEGAENIPAIIKYKTEDIPFNPSVLRKCVLLDEGHFHEKEDGSKVYYWQETRHFPKNEDEKNFDYIPEESFSKDVENKRVRYYLVTPEDFVGRLIRQYNPDRWKHFIDCQVIDVDGGVTTTNRSIKSFNNSNYFAWFRFDDSKILTVVHMDYNNTYEYVHLFVEGTNKEGEQVFFNGRFDDHIGLYTIAYLYSKFGIKSDFLFTTNEEFGATTAKDFTKWVEEDQDRIDYCKKYNWAVQFDRNGTDTVLYDYDGPTFRKCVSKFTTVGHGSFSCISKLTSLGICAANWGTGYKQEHSQSHYLHVENHRKMFAQFLNFYESYQDYKWIYSKEDPEYKIKSYGYAYTGRGGYSGAWGGEWDDYDYVASKYMRRPKEDLSSYAELNLSDSVFSKEYLYGFDYYRNKLIRISNKNEQFIIVSNPTKDTDLYILRHSEDFEGRYVFFAYRRDIRFWNTIKSRKDIDIDTLLFWYGDLVAIKDHFYLLFDESNDNFENIWQIADYDYHKDVGIVYAIARVIGKNYDYDHILWVSEAELFLLERSSSRGPELEKDIYPYLVPRSLITSKRTFKSKISDEEESRDLVYPLETDFRTIPEYLKEHPDKHYCKSCKNFYKTGDMHYGKAGDFCNRCYAFLSTRYPNRNSEELINILNHRTEQGYNLPGYLTEAFVYSILENRVYRIKSTESRPGTYKATWNVIFNDEDVREVQDIVRGHDIRYIMAQPGYFVKLNEPPTAYLGTSIANDYDMMLLPFNTSERRPKEATKNYIEVFIPDLGETLKVDATKINVIKTREDI